jgi:phospholipase C
VFHQPDSENPDGYLLPFHLDTQTTSAQRIPSTSHSWAVQHEAWNGGKMDRWLPAHRKADGLNAPYVMGYHTRADIPFQFALAEAFTICDAYHCSVMGPTWPNRMYWMTGTIDPTGKRPAARSSTTRPRTRTAFTWTTYAERLERPASAGRSTSRRTTTAATCSRISRRSGKAGRRRSMPRE